MNPLWSPLVGRLTPYVPGEQPKIQNLIKLNTNELPHPPSPRVIAAIQEAAASLQLYPDPESTALRSAIARRFDLEASQVFVGNGSDEVLAHAFQAFFNHGDPVLFPDVTYSFYPVYCELYGLTFRKIPVNDDLQIQAGDYAGPCGGVVIPNPNAPTGQILTPEDICTILKAVPDRVVLIDEAYVDFGATSSSALINEFPNLLVVQTLSKSRGLAGLRVGFAMGHPSLIEALTRVKDSFNSYPLDRLAQAGAQAAIEDEAWLQETTAKIIATRTVLTSELSKLGLRVLPSGANFVYASHTDRDAATLAARLRERGIIVRHLKGPRTSDWLRITIGTDDQCAKLIEELRDILLCND